MFTKACEYGLRAAVFIARKSNEHELVNLKTIAAAIESPVAFTAKILQTLVRENIVESVQGKSGGFRCPPEKFKQIRIQDIILALDPGYDRNSCVLGLPDCNEKNPCPAHEQYKAIRRDIQVSLLNITLHQMVEGEGMKHTVLKRSASRSKV